MILPRSESSTVSRSSDVFISCARAKSECRSLRCSCLTESRCRSMCLVPPACCSRTARSRSSSDCASFARLVCAAEAAVTGVKLWPAPPADGAAAAEAGMTSSGTEPWPACNCIAGDDSKKSADCPRSARWPSIGAGADDPLLSDASAGDGMGIITEPVEPGAELNDARPGDGTPSSACTPLGVSFGCTDVCGVGCAAAAGALAAALLTCAASSAKRTVSGRSCTSSAPRTIGSTVRPSWYTVLPLKVTLVTTPLSVCEPVIDADAPFLRKSRSISTSIVVDAPPALVGCGRPNRRIGASYRRSLTSASVSLPCNTAVSSSGRASRSRWQTASVACSAAASSPFVASNSRPATLKQSMLGRLFHRCSWSSAVSCRSAGTFSPL
eukprot:Unigene7697_Nuclearia_a/m.23640 Unigene7697_Nuclearia_a/g.23640  ORF Unigene7697_Nuclearia_a/g.23640 Unigene7697_Nuclearia_a/m.23640 type:complete len:383 (+) Unigene7697_Nuclearia_a:844-1992(+)